MMNTLFEYADKLNSPYECFIFDSTDTSLPVRPHWHYFVEILYMIEGSVLVNCDDQSYVLNENDMVLFLPQALHSIYATTNLSAKYYVLKFDLSQLAPSSSTSGTAFSGIHFSSLFQLAKTSANANIFFSQDTFDTDYIRRLFEEGTKEIAQQEYGYRIIVQSDINSLLTYILRIWRTNGFDTDRAYALPHEDTTIHYITEYIDSHAHEALKVEDLAELCNMSYSYFAKNFRELYGQSCKKYIEFIRLSKAEDLLLFTNLDLNYISQETGFSDCSHFIKAFRSHHNMTPKQFRREHAGK